MTTAANGSAVVTPDGARMRWVGLPGEGRPTVFLPGLGCHAAQSWAATAVRLGRPSWVVDLLGQGLSDRSHDASYSLVEQADAVATLIETLDVGPVDLLSHSLGGSIAVVLADRRPELVHRSVLVEPGLDPVEVQPGDLAAWDDGALLAGGWEQLLAQESESRRPEMALCDPVAIVRSARAITDALGGRMPQVLAATTVPTLVVAGWRTYAQPDLLSTGNVRFARVEGGGHFVMLDRPAEFLAVTRAFLDAGAP